MKDDKNKIYLILMACVIFFVVIAFYFSPLNTSRWLKINTVAQRKVMTWNTMRDIALHCSYLVSRGNKHPIEIEDVINFHDENFSDFFKYDIQKNIIYDGWQVPITITFIEPASYKFVSFGPNRTDDQGLKDDIVRVYSIGSNDIEQVENNIVR